MKRYGRIDISKVSGFVMSAHRVNHTFCRDGSCGHAIQPASAVQTEYSLMNRDVEQNCVLKTCEELGIGFVPWGPMGQGYLTVKIDAQTKFDPKMDVRSEFPRFSSENIAANMPMVDFLRQFSEKKNATPAQISLAWLLAQEPFIVPIPGTRSTDHLHENLRAVYVRLTPADLRQIETVLSKIKVHGGRMNEERMMAVDQTA
jgi:aryl-alcohol dehydrogenase-like predicted oxidoreductase